MIPRPGPVGLLKQLHAFRVTPRSAMRFATSLLIPLLGLVLIASPRGHSNVAEPPGNAEFKDDVRPLLQKYCLGCHSTKLKKGSLDLERFGSIDDIRKDVKPCTGTRFALHREGCLTLSRLHHPPGQQGRPRPRATAPAQ